MKIPGLGRAWQGQPQEITKKGDVNQFHVNRETKSPLQMRVTKLDR